MICPNNADTKKSLHFTARGEEEEGGKNFAFLRLLLACMAFNRVVLYSLKTTFWFK
jgi:hypothetical protein